jgi:hypothetical protein
VFSIIVVPGGCTGPAEQIRLAPGECLEFGREAPGPEPAGTKRWLTVGDGSVSRHAGTLTAAASHWTLSNLSGSQTYVVENPEGAGEHIKVAPGRVDAPVPFEFSRLVLPARDALLGIEVWAPRHVYRSREHADAAAPAGRTTAPAFPLDRSKRYFLVLAALCEPRLRDAPHAPLPTTGEVAARLAARWPAVTVSAVQWNIDYLAVKMRLKQAPECAMSAPRLNGKKESLVALALRFDLVREEDLVMLNPEGAG